MTEKQARRRSQNEVNAGPQMTRRNFLKLGVGALGALALLELSAASLIYMKPRSLEGEFGGIVTAGATDSFPDGTVTEFPAGRFFLIRSETGGFLAVYRKCTHLGCAVSWEANENRFICPCHGSFFNTEGDVENPPAPRALDTFTVTIEDDRVFVDTSRLQTRDMFAPEQLVFA